MRLDGRVAVVTGGARGIGRAISEKLADAGARVVVVYSSSSQAADELVRQIEDGGGEALALRADVANAADAAEVMRRTLERFSAVDILVNNAGITDDSLLIRMSDEQWQRVLDVNLKGTFHFTRAAARPMIKAKAGSIVNITSIIGVMGNPGQANYAASKAGIIGFTKSVARELGSRGIRANAVAPGFIETDMTHGIEAAQREQMMSEVPLGRFGSADEVADVVVFLASDESRYVTGQVLHVDGGMVT